MILINLVGRKFGRLKVIKRSQNDKWGGTCWLCKCECGAMRTIPRTSLVSGRTKSCGCLNKEILSKRRLKHGDTRGKKWNPLYYVWWSMLKRCEDSKTKAFKYYGEKGISVCSEWHDYRTFRDWALANGYKKGREIHRINNNESYEPKNCEWLTVQEHRKIHKPRFNLILAVKLYYEGASFTELSTLFKIDRSTIRNRLKEHNFLPKLNRLSKRRVGV